MEKQNYEIPATAREEDIFENYLLDLLYKSGYMEHWI